jgi:hypothetical protein
MSDDRIDDPVASENTPLLGESRPNGHGDHTTEHQGSDLPKPTRRRRWPILLALAILCILVVLIMLFGFFVPDAMKQYAIEAADVHIQSVVPELTDSGAHARIRAKFAMRSSKVRSRNIRNLGVFGTWLAQEVESSESRVVVTLPDYGDAVLGTAVVPSLKVSVVNGQTTDLDFTTTLVPPSSVDPLKGMFDDWINGKLEFVKVAGAVKIGLRSGIIWLPSSDILHTFTISGMGHALISRIRLTWDRQRATKFTSA